MHQLGKMRGTMILLAIVSSAMAYTDVPIIGILSQETFAIDNLFPEKYDSFISASYVKFLESGGARVIPVMIGKDEEYYRKVVTNTNGILFPGGESYFNQSCGYAEAGQMIYDYALKINKNGDYYPILGICLGMELLIEVAVGLSDKEIREPCLAKKICLPLEFKKGSNESKTFSNATDEVLKILANDNVTYNNHHFCLTERGMKEYDLDKDWKVLSTNKDVHGLEFISSYESRSYPFYGVQFHPEKTMFEFNRSLNIPHSRNAIIAAQYFANSFVEETRKSNHSFKDWESEQKSLIYNYPTHFTGIQNSSYTELYVFKKADFPVHF